MSRIPRYSKKLRTNLLSRDCVRQYLYDLYNETTEQTALSKIKLVEGITKHVTANYEIKMQTQAEQLQQTNLLLQQAKQMAAKPNVWLIALLLVIGLLAGAVLAYLFFK